MGLRIFFYILFSVGAAPFEAWAYYLNGLGDSNAKITNYPWSHGLIYVVSILLLAETIFRIMHHWHILKEIFFAQILLTICAALVVVIGFWYVLTERGRIVAERPLVDATGYYQNWCLSIALILAWVTFITIERTVSVGPKRPPAKVEPHSN